MSREFDVIIIGAGPAGLFTAANVKSGRKVLILEKNRSAGKKVLMSGSGRCNITQSGSIGDFFRHYGDNHRFMIPALKEFTNNDLIAYLNEQGINVIINKNGKVFPASENSGDVLAILLSDCKKKRIDIHYNEFVKKIEKSEERFVVQTNLETYFCSKLVIATGGKSYPTTGSTGDGYLFAKALGHSLVKPKPALTPVYIKNYSFSEISGVSFENIKISLFRDNRKIKEHTGDIGFTHWGLSGPGILDFSRDIEPNDILKINLVKQYTDEFRKFLNETAIEEGKLSVKKFLKRFELPESLIKLVLSEINLDENSHLAGINKTMRNRLVDLFCEFPITVERTGDYNIAMVTSGGVSLKEVSPKTMESKLVKNLYFAGEVLDIDGDTGGYNLQAAFSTGFLAAKNL